MGVWGAIANKMGASLETFLWVKITQASFQIIKWYVPKKSFIYDLFESFIYAVKLERNYIGIWGSGGESPQKPGTFQRIR